MLENILKWRTDSDANLTDEDRSAGWKLPVFIYVHLRLSAPAMSTDNSQVGVAICPPF